MLWLLAAQDGLLDKEAVRAQFDGSLFWKIAAERERQGAARAEARATKWE